MEPQLNIRQGFDSVYEHELHIHDDIKNTGYDYTHTLLEKNLSGYMYKNRVLKLFLTRLNYILVYFVNRVKYLRVYYNFGVDKNYQKIN